MKIAVINFSGNVGKSTVARHLLAPRIPGSVVIPVESINSDGGQDEAIRGKQFGELQEALALADSAVVDVGASNVEDFIGLMKQYRGSHEDYDFFVVPTVPKSKQLRDTISTIDSLTEIGVGPKKIRLLFNMLELDEMPERVCAGIFEFYAHTKSFTLRPDAAIRVNDIYGKIKQNDCSISDLKNDATDYKDKIKTASDPAEKVRYAQLLSVQRLAAGVTEELDRVFKALLK